MVDHGSGRFSQWMSSGLLATIAWFVMLIVYVVFRSLGIEDPLLGQAFLLLTGAWVGNLTLAQGKKQASVEQKVERLEERADVSEIRADEAETRVNKTDTRVERKADKGHGHE